MTVIEPKEIDVGRKVVYRDRHGWKVEEGVITSFNDTCVFVRYGADTGSKGTRREDLEWLAEAPLGLTPNGHHPTGPLEITHGCGHMKYPHRRNVLLDGEPPPPGETERFVEVLKGNDRMWEITLRNRGRVRRGTATVWRWRWIMEAIKKRHPAAHMSPKGKEPIMVRARKFGPIVVTCTALEGPVRRLMN